MLLFADYEKNILTILIWPKISTVDKLFYNDISTMIINNGHLSEPFKVERGVKQGCQGFHCHPYFLLYV